MAYVIAVNEGFDHTTALAGDIRRFASMLVGRPLGEIPGVRFTDDPVRGKGEIGLAVETFFGIPAGNAPEADFVGAGIELKVVPLVRSGNALKTKERTVIGMIDYRSLISEAWESAHVRKKLSILFVFYEHVVGQPKSTYLVKAIKLWSPGKEEPILKRDWQTVRDKVLAGLAHELSESDGRLMGPCTKGSSSRVRVPQPVTRYAPVAKPRAFALKPAFTTALYRRIKGDDAAMQSLMAQLAISEIDRFESTILRHYDRFVGRTLAGLLLS